MNERATGGAQVPIYCPHFPKCDWSYAGTKKRGQGFLETHVRVVHKGGWNGMDTHAGVKPSEARRNGAAKPTTEPARMDTPDGHSGQRVAAWTREEALAAFRAFHAEHGRWPLASDQPGRGTLPSPSALKRLGWNWQAVWTELDAGKVPIGRAAQKYLGRLIVQSAKPPPEDPGSPPDAPEPPATPSALPDILPPADGQPEPPPARREPLRLNELRLDPDLLENEAAYLRRRAQALEMLANGTRTLTQA